MKIDRSFFYSGQHVTGPACVLVSIKFGATPEGGPRVIRKLAEGAVDSTPKFDLANHVTEILAGVSQANLELGGSLQVECIEVVPDDYPRPTQAQYVAYKIARAVLSGEV